MDSQYTEAHRVLLTYLRSVRAISVDKLTAKFKILAEDLEIEVSDPLTSLREYIATINYNLERFGFKVETARDQALGDLQYVFVNAKFDDVIQKCTPYTPPELDAVKQLIDSIVEASLYEFCVPYGNAKQQAGSVLKLRASDAAFFLTRLIDDGWIEVTSHNRVVLSSAALAELKVYLTDRFGVMTAEDSLGKLLVCHVCGDLVTLGAKCPQSECPSAFHRKCYSVFARGRTECPNRRCGAVLEKMADVGAAP